MSGSKSQFARRLIFNLHLYLALAAAVFVTLMGLTGSIMAFEPELDRLFHRQLSYVQPGNKALSLEQISGTVHAAYPSERIRAFVLALSPNLAYQVILEKSGAVYIDQYTGKILGTRVPRLEFLDYVHQLHIRLAWQREGDPGKKIMSWAGVGMLCLLLSGLYLWWPAKRMMIGKGVSGRRWWFDLHNMLGIFAFVFLLSLTVTGILIGFERTTNPLFYKLTGTKPSELPKTVPPPAPGAKPIPLDQVVEIAGRALPGAAPFAVLVPPPRAPYRVALRYPEDLTPGGRSRVMIDQYSGQVLFAEGSRGAPAGARIAIVNRALHTGDIFGIPSKIILSITSLVLVLQVLSGVVMWWKRIRARSKVSNLAQSAAS